ncbi:chitin synthase-domain-containing protein [Blastocladiella britannica]|nr:chitin synthase-domain-containing protein [Blastocladiella britannica]
MSAQHQQPQPAHGAAATDNVDMFDSHGNSSLLPSHVGYAMQQAALAHHSSTNLAGMAAAATGSASAAATTPDGEVAPPAMEKRAKRKKDRKSVSTSAAAAPGLPFEPPATATSAHFSHTSQQNTSPTAVSTEREARREAKRRARKSVAATTTAGVAASSSMAELPDYEDEPLAVAQKRRSVAMSLSGASTGPDTPLSRSTAPPPMPAGTYYDDDGLPIAVSERRKSLYSDHRMSVASFSSETGLFSPPPPSVFAPATPSSLMPSGSSISGSAAGGARGSVYGPGTGAYQMHPVGGDRPMSNGITFAADAPGAHSSYQHQQQQQQQQQQPGSPASLTPPGESTFAKLTRKLSGRRRMPGPTHGPSPGLPSPSDIETAHPNAMHRKRSLVRRDRAPPSAAGYGARNTVVPPYGQDPAAMVSPAATGGYYDMRRAMNASANGAAAPPPPPPPAPNNGPIPPSISRRPVMPNANELDFAPPQTSCRRWWIIFSTIVTFYVPTPLMRMFGMTDPEVQQAWREKIALVTIIVLMMLLLGFLTFALQAVLCPPESSGLDVDQLGAGNVVINGFAFDVSTYNHNFNSAHGQFPFERINGEDIARSQRDLSFMFQNEYALLPDCMTAFGPTFLSPKGTLFPCTIGGVAESSATSYGSYPRAYCHANTNLLVGDVQSFVSAGKRKALYVTWEALEDPDNHYIAFNGDVIDLNVLSKITKPIDWTNVQGINVNDVFQRYRNADASMYFASNSTMVSIGKCLSSVARIGTLDSTTMGCLTSQVVQYLSLLVIVSLVLCRFIMALIFRWIISPKLGRRLDVDEKRAMLRLRNARERDASLFSGRTASVNAGGGAGKHYSMVMGDGSPRLGYSDSSSTLGGNGGAYIQDPMTASPKLAPETRSVRSMASHDALGGSNRGSFIGAPRRASALMGNSAYLTGLPDPDISAEEVMHSILLVTCYSEDEQGIRTTLNSLAATAYLDTHKLMFVIADGIIMGHGNDKSTPEIIVSMMEKDPTFPEVPKPYSYVAIAEGTKRHNMAAVHAGYYNYEGHRVPMVVVVKCGGPEEKDMPKPGNRGKRDSQIVLMSFLQKVMFDERMTPLEYDLFQKIHKVARVTPDAYEMVLMVDADTAVATDSLERMVACFARDPSVMGLCGETQIENKWGSPTTMIQVFEYYISHHLAKAFESVFGGVTCLPGCFCAYRIKVPKSDRHWVPILANPDVVDQYQENVVDTLHKKNLLLLGEDRYLTTLMLKTFPKRKMMFVPQATCVTTVPDSFSVLLSQRRRWINSTIHNLLELVLVKDLCGTFCISMQFVIFMELIGTVVLPAAISFTIYLIVISFLTTPVPVIPLILLGLILGLPGILIILTTRKVEFLFWMVVYLFSLPVWNFVLPTYAFWHFDDFSWGATRMVAGAGAKDGHGDDDGEFDSSKIIMKRYAEWEQIKQKAIAQALQTAAQQHAIPMHMGRQSMAYYGVENQLVARGGQEYTA